MHALIFASLLKWLFTEIVFVLFFCRTDYFPHLDSDDSRHSTRHPFQFSPACIFRNHTESIKPASVISERQSGYETVFCAHSNLLLSFGWILPLVIQWSDFTASTKSIKNSTGRKKRHASNPSLLWAAVHLCEHLNVRLRQNSFSCECGVHWKPKYLLPHLPSACFLINRRSLTAVLAMAIIIKFFLIPLSLCWSSAGCKRSRASTRFQLGAVFPWTGISILKVRRVR